MYVDGFNCYYGGRSLVDDGRSWKWVDYRAMVNALLVDRWPGAGVARLVYCTARVSGDLQAAQRQDVYLRALVASGSADLIEEGFFTARVTTMPLAQPDRRGSEPQVLRLPESQALPEGLPLRRATHDAETLMADVLKREEKGSDVNIATWLLADVLGGVVDGAVVLTNDSDLGLPLAMARNFVPVGVVNPRGRPTAGALRGIATEGVGGHWWHRLSAEDFVSSQLPSVVVDAHGHSVARPAAW